MYTISDFQTRIWTRETSPLELRPVSDLLHNFPTKRSKVALKGTHQITHLTTVPPCHPMLSQIITSSGTLSIMSPSRAPSHWITGIFVHAYISILYIYGKKYSIWNKYLISFLEQTVRQYLLYTLHNTVCTCIWLELQEQIKYNIIYLTRCEADLIPGLWSSASYETLLHLGHTGLNIWMWLRLNTQARKTRYTRYLSQHRSDHLIAVLYVSCCVMGRYTHSHLWPFVVYRQPVVIRRAAQICWSCVNAASVLWRNLCYFVPQQNDVDDLITVLSHCCKTLTVAE